LETITKGQKKMQHPNKDEENAHNVEQTFDLRKTPLQLVQSAAIDLALEPTKSQRKMQQEKIPRDGGATGPSGVRSRTPRSPTRPQPTGNISKKVPAVSAMPSSSGVNPQTPAYYKQTPGAHKVSPSGRLKEESSELLMEPSETWNTPLQAATTAATGDITILLTAIPVEDKEEVVNESLPLAVAQKDSCCGFLKQYRRAQLAIFLVAFALIGMAVGLGIAFSNNSDEDKSVGDSDSEDFFELVGRPLDGPNMKEMYGASISLSQDGKRMVTADLQGVHIFDLLDVTPQDSEDDEEDWVELTVIPSPGNNLGGAIPINDMIRASVVVDISRDGRYVVIGWPFASGGDDDTNDDQPTNIGRVEVYRENPSSIEWERRGNIIFGEAAQDFFGSSVSLSEDGGVLAVGVGGPGNGELVRVYMLDAGIWIPRGGKINIGGMLFLGSVSLSANGLVLAVGGIPTYADENPAVVRIFRLESGEWLELGEGVNGKIEDTAYQAALSGDGTIVAVSNYYVGPVGSAQAESNDALDARALEWSPDQNQWILLGENLHASAPGPKSGFFISLSDDGTIIAMSDPGTPGQSGGGVTGHAHIYKYDGDSWTQLGPNQNGEAAGDQFGFDVSISGDGRHFAVGAPMNRGSGMERGRVYVYALDG
jgi:hypothetical protein